VATYQVAACQAIGDTLAHWRKFVEFFGGGFTTIGWTAQTGHGELTSTGTGATYTITGLALPTTTLANVTGPYHFKGAWVSGNTYIGGNALATTTTDIVTDGGLSYVHVTASSSLTSPSGIPGTDTTNWQPIFFEIWKSSGAQSTSHPIYVRITYTLAGSAFTVGSASTGPGFHFALGTGIDSDGNITGAITINPASAPFTNGLQIVAQTGNSATGDMNFAGDSDNFRFMTWRGLATGGYQWIVVCDRAKTASGTDSDAFAYVAQFNMAGTNATGGSQRIGGAILYKPSLGTPANIAFAASNPLPGLVGNGSITTTMSQFGATPPFPIFPPVGYLGNPLLGMVGFQKGDVQDGQVMPVWMYGASHNYLASAANISSGNNNANGVANSMAPAILWE